MPALHNRKGRSTSGPSFSQLYHYLQDSEAWLHLTPAERSVYLEIARLYNGINNGRLALSVRDAADRCRINKDTASRAFHSLVEHGFIECASQGGFSFKQRHAAEWRLTAEMCNRTQMRPSKAFMRWQPAPGLERKSRSGKRNISVP